MEPKTYSFLTDNVAYLTVETKAGKKFYVTGYISTTDIDIENDIVTKNAMDSMLRQIMSTTITLDYEHEAWRDDNTLLPVGKITKAKVDDRGLWVQVELNRSSPKFKDLWGSIKGGFVKAFSIAFRPIKTVMKTIDNVQYRVLEDLELLNVALTGAPVNPGAVMTDFGMKSIMAKACKEYKENETMEDTKMSEDKKPEEDTKAEEVKPEPTEKKPVESEKKPEEKQEKPKEEMEEKQEKPKEEMEDEKKPEQKSQVSKEEFEAVKAELKSLKAVLDKGVFKSGTPVTPEQKSVEDKRSVLGMIQ